MRTATHHPHKRAHGHSVAKIKKLLKKTGRTTTTKIRKLAKNGHTSSKFRKLMKPVKAYVTKKPAKTIGIASLVTAFVLGAVYAKMRYFNHHH